MKELLSNSRKFCSGLIDLLQNKQAKALMIAISSANVVSDSTAFHRLDLLQGSNQCSIAPLA